MKAAMGSVMLLVRRYRLDGNPLRRRSDRLESAVVVGALLLVLVSVWPAVLAGRLAYETGMAQNRIGPGGLRQVTATLLEDVPRTRVSFGEASVQEPPVRARWTTPEGEPRTGPVVAPALSKSGATVRIWIDAGGMPAGAPKKPLEIQAQSAGMTLFLVMMTALTAFTALVVVQWLLERRRLLEWDAAWARADERWNRPRRRS